MFREKKRYGQNGSHIHRSAQATFNKPLSWKSAAKVFTCSWSDFFLPEADTWRPEAWDIIRRTPHLTYQILTKRPERIKDCLPGEWPLPNVWLGVTCENTQMLFNRLKHFLEIPAKIKFISAEPMLEPIEMDNIMYGLKLFGIKGKIDWVICGGESGAKFRRMDPMWAEWLLDECRLLGIPFFMKQMAGYDPKKIPIPDRLNVREFPTVSETT